MYGSYANQQYNSNFVGVIISTTGNDEGALILACSTANLYLYCVVSYEMLFLLRNNNKVITHNPPSLLRVTLQAISVYLLSIIVFIIHYSIGKESIKADIDDDYEKGWRLASANLIWSILVTYLCPNGHFFYFWNTIKCRNYMQSFIESTKQLLILLFFLWSRCIVIIT